MLTTRLIVFILWAASTSYAVPIDTTEDSSLDNGDYSSIGSLTYPTDTDVAYWDDIDEEERWNEIQQVDVPRQLSKRSPKLKKKFIKTKLISKKVLKKGAFKLPKFKKFGKPTIKKLTKFGAASQLSLPSLPTLGAVSLVGGGAGAGAGGLAAVFGPPAAASLSRTFG